MKFMVLGLILLLTIGCTQAYIEKHLMIEGDDIVVPINAISTVKGKKVKFTRDVIIRYGNVTKTENIEKECN